ncbi:MAG TPA: EAL domain-containing protein [Abditibacteriaceae bacterium]|jgi:diguanylate cyclase (GGDEF)-like protein/PAS domain S-box-containing protein
MPFTKPFTDRSREFYISLLENFPVPVWSADEDGGCNYCNAAWLRCTGGTLDQALGDGWMESVHPDDRAELAVTLKAAVENQSSFEIEYRLRQHDGVYRLFHHRAEALHHENRFHGFIALCQSTTLQSQAVEGWHSGHKLIAGMQKMAHLGSWQRDLRTHETTWSDELYRIYGLDPATTTIDAETAYKYIHPADIVGVRETVSRCIRDGHQFEFYHRIVRPDGTQRTVQARGAIERDHKGEPLYLFGTMLDVTELKQVEAALRQSEERYALAARGANEGLWDWDLNTETIHYSPRWKEMLGFAEDEIDNSPEEWLGRVHVEDVEEVREKIVQHRSGETPYFESEYRMRHRDGTFRWMRSRGLAVRDENGKAYRMAGSQSDVTENKHAEQQLVHNTLHDALTGLPNRVLFRDRLARAMERAKRHDDYLIAVLFLDFDHFKVINDSLGHMMGDLMLKTVARRLQECLRGNDTVARLGGDEFTILLDDITDAGDAVDAARRIQKAMKSPFNLGGNKVRTDVSIGIALSRMAPDPIYSDPEEILRDADTAMYRAKNMGRGRYEIFDKAMHAQAMKRAQLEAELRHAIEENQLILHYQPIVDLTSGEISGFETLVRWQHPQRGTIAPEEFIPLAEETGIVVPLDRWVLHEACRQYRAWKDALHGNSPENSPAEGAGTGTIAGEDAGQTNSAPGEGTARPSAHNGAAGDAATDRITSNGLADDAIGVEPSLPAVRADSQRPLSISVNLSSRHFSRPDTIEFIQRVLDETGVVAGNLKIEIRENVLMQKSEPVAHTLRRLRDMGIQLSMDDFGTGYSSLSCLHRFPVHTLKIDRSFISQADVPIVGKGKTRKTGAAPPLSRDISAHNLEIIRAIIALAHNLKVDVIAEGVETPEQMAQLRDLECEYGQGHFFAAPVDSQAAQNMLTQRRRW